MAAASYQKKVVHAPVRRESPCSLDRLFAAEVAQLLLHAPWNEEQEKHPDEMKAESQAAGYFAMISKKFELSLRVCGGSLPSVCIVHESRVKEQGRVGVVRPVKVPHF